MGFMSDFWAGTEAQRNLRDMAQENIQRANVEYASLNKQLQSATDEQTRKDILSKMDGVQAKIAGNTPMATQALGFSGSLLNNLASSPEAIKNSFNALSDSFAQGINNFFNRQNTDRVSPNGASDHLRNQATMHEQQSGDLQKAQQQSQQIANRDYHTEADKNAVAGAATENAQRVQNLSASAGAGAAALNRQVKSSDYNTMMNRQDAQRDKAVERDKEAWDVRQQAERERAAADNSDYMGYLAATENQESNTLSKASNKTADNTNSIPYVYSSKDTLPKNTEPSEPTGNAQTGNAPEPAPEPEDRPAIPQGTESENNPNGTHNVYWDTRRNQYVVYTDEDAKNVHAGRLKLTKRCNTRAEADEECRRLNGQHNVDYSRTGGNNMPDNVGVGDNFAAATNSDYYKQYDKVPSDATCKNIIKGLYRRF